jgi:hypothetical protein
MGKKNKPKTHDCHNAVCPHSGQCISDGQNERAGIESKPERVLHTVHDTCEGSDPEIVRHRQFGDGITECGRVGEQYGSGPDHGRCLTQDHPLHPEKLNSTEMVETVMETVNHNITTADFKNYKGSVTTTEVNTMIRNVTVTRNTMISQETKNNQIKKYLSLQGAGCHVTISSDMIMSTVVDGFSDAFLSVIDPNGPRASESGGLIDPSTLMPEWTKWNVDWILVAIVLGDTVSFFLHSRKGRRP